MRESRKVLFSFQRFTVLINLIVVVATFSLEIFIIFAISIKD